MDAATAVSPRPWLAQVFTTTSRNHHHPPPPFRLSANQTQHSLHNASREAGALHHALAADPSLGFATQFGWSDSLTTTTTTTTMDNFSVEGSASTVAPDPVHWCVNETWLPSDEEFREFYTVAQFVTGLVLYPCVCVPGLIGNVLTILVLSRRNMRTSTNAFLSALAVADSVKLVSDLLYFLTILLLRVDDEIGNKAYGYLYPYAHFVFGLSVCVSAWLTVSVAVERYLMVCHPTRARHVCSRKRAVAVCVGVFVVMTTLELPSALRYRTVRCTRRDTLKVVLEVELTELWRSDTFVLVFNWTQNLLRSVVPLVVLAVVNTCIIGALRKTRANRKNSSRHRVTLMLMIVLLAFFVFITPDAVMSTVLGLGYTESSSYLAKGVREFTDTLLAVNAACNFVIYCLFNRVFLAGCRSLFCSSASSASTTQTGTEALKKKWQTELDESQYKRLNSDGEGGGEEEGGEGGGGGGERRGRNGGTPVSLNNNSTTHVSETVLNGSTPDL